MTAQALSGIAKDLTKMSVKSTLKIQVPADAHSALFRWVGLHSGLPAGIAVLSGLGLFGVIFAINSAVHSYRILAYSQGDEVATDVGFFYMSNACGRLPGTLFSGLTYQCGGLEACLWTSMMFSGFAAMASCWLPRHQSNFELSSLSPAKGGCA